MDLTKKHKLMMLFLSPDNPVLRRIRVFETGRKVHAIDKDDVLEIAGISRQTAPNWRKGQQMRKSKADGVFPHVLRHLDRSAERARERNRFEMQEYQDLRAIVERFAAAYESGDLDVYDVAGLLGMSTAECQQTVDTAIYDRWPLLPAVYYPKAPKGKGEQDYAQAEADRYEGIYLVWVRRNALWLQCPLRVRYLQDVGDGRFLRCKMNFPIIAHASGGAQNGHGVGLDHWEYDGFLAIRECKLFWTFEKRQRERNDYFHFVTNTESKSPSNHMTLSGRYLTTGQDKGQSVVTGALLMHRMFSADGADRLHLHYRELMWKSAKVLTGEEEIRNAEERWAKYRTHSSDDLESS